MKKAALILVAALAALNGALAQGIPDTSMVGGVSGQFLVSNRGLQISANSKRLASEANMAELQPPLTAVSCERIKQELLRALGMRDQWQGKIFVVLYPAQSLEDPISVIPERFGGNWNCAVRLPNVVDRNRFVAAVLRACLLEIANRNATSSSTEIPEWLVQGFTRQLIDSSAQPLLLTQGDETVNGYLVKRLKVDLTDNPKVSGPNIRNLNPLAGAIATMHTNSPLSFEELSWPTDEQISGDAQPVFDCSSQLLVSQLLRLKGGAAAMRTMLARLPNYLNWQLAFYEAFQGNFKDALEVEKWWSLQMVQFSGRDLLHLWTPEESARQLDAYFNFPINVQIGPGTPMRTTITFQTVIRGWSRTRQLELFKKKLWDLDILRQRVALDDIPILDGYRQVLQDYYKARTNSKDTLPRSAPLVRNAVNEAIEKLDALDARRAEMQPGQQAPLASAGDAVTQGATP